MPIPAPDFRSTARQVAFTLVELLVVMTIAVVIIGLAIPAVNSITNARGVSRSINDVTGIIEYARATAMARRTYVWVAFMNTTNLDNNSELRMVAAASKNGLNDVGSPLPGSNLLPLTRMVKVAGVQTVMYKDLPKTFRDYVLTTAADLKTDDNYVAFRSGFTPLVVAGQSFEKASYIEFSPQGEILTNDPVTRDPYNLMFQTLACVGLAPTRGTTVQANAVDGAVVTVYGASAKLRITRP